MKKKNKVDCKAERAGEGWKLKWKVNVVENCTKFPVLVRTAF